MPNPLDQVTQNQRDDALRPRVYIYGNDDRPAGTEDVPYQNKLTQAVAPAQQYDLPTLIAQVKAYVNGAPGTGNASSPGADRAVNRLLGTGGEERHQTWPERMVRSGVTLAGDTLSGAEPVVDPETGRTSERVIERAQDMAGLAGGGALTERPGVATLGSGPMRPAMKPTESIPVFYSALEHATTNAAQETMSPGQWLGYLKNQPGVKAEELAWTGLPEWLNGQKGKVKKEDVKAYLDEHKVEIKDVTKASEGYHISQDMIDDAESYARQHNDWSEFERLQEQYEAQELNQLGETKYSSYQLPGGENYREHLLTMPYRGPETTGGVLKLGANNPNYKSSHWDEPNVLAHVRTNDRDVGGQKSLHIEEIQSDWHQQGRKQGYKGKEPTLEEIEAHASNYFDNIIAKDETHWNKLSEQEKVPYREKAREALKNGVGVPDAPFKTTWPELALKRMIRHAAENGYDRISWTPGEAQAARYDLSKQVKLLSAQKTGDKYNVYIEGKDGQPLFRRGNGWSDHGQKTMTAEELEATIGKEPAKKIIEGKPNKEGWVDVKDEGLKVGGEGMREFYDKMLPKMAEKIGKAHGVKVKQNSLPGPLSNKMGEPPLDVPVHYFDLPQSLKDHAVGKGFPLYVSGIPFPLTPVDHDPFEKK